MFINHCSKSEKFDNLGFSLKVSDHFFLEGLKKKNIQNQRVNRLSNKSTMPYY